MARRYKRKTRAESQREYRTRRALYEKYKQEAKNINGLYFIGRLGDYKYYNMDLAIERIFEIFVKKSCWGIDFF